MVHPLAPSSLSVDVALSVGAGAGVAAAAERTALSPAASPTVSPTTSTQSQSYSESESESAYSATSDAIKPSPAHPSVRLALDPLLLPGPDNSSSSSSSCTSDRIQTSNNNNSDSAHGYNNGSISPSSSTGAAAGSSAGTAATAATVVEPPKPKRKKEHLDGKPVRAGEFEAERHFYPRVLNANIHPLVSSFFSLGNERILARYTHLNPQVNFNVLKELLDYKPKYFQWAGMCHATFYSALLYSAPIAWMLGCLDAAGMLG
eukprot:jgi/Hompol1/3332/HPOL_002455-RA